MQFTVRDVVFLGKGPYSLSVSKNECVGLSGRSGIGKTLLFRALTDLIPFSGSILLDGIDCLSFPPPEWRSRVTMIPADASWWYDQVRDHFPQAGDTALLKKRCKLLGLDPEILGWQVRRLSTGERQRLALLRGLQHDPTVLLLDEPSASLDVYHTELMELFVKQYKRENQSSIIWVSHDPEQLERVAERTYTMEQGELFESR